MNTTRTLYVAYPLLPVTEESAGGAEQMLHVLESEAARAGYSTTTAACAGSRMAGQLYATTVAGRGTLHSAAMEERKHALRTLELISIREAIGCKFDLIHDKSGSFFTYAGKLDVPVLATLHLPRSFYPRHYFAHLPENVFFNCVSQSQARSFQGLGNMAGVVQNGIRVERFTPRARKKDHLLWMGRICEEKGTHIALDIAEKSGLPVVIAGQVYPFQYHQQYFDREIRPRLKRMKNVVFMESPTFKQKAALLENARALLVTSLVDETSSLVAMEAAASGTPVIAFARGALPEVVRHNETGVIVRNNEEMVEAVAETSQISWRVCREVAEEEFSAARMAREYFKLYEQVRASHASHQEHGAVAA